MPLPKPCITKQNAATEFQSKLPPPRPCITKQNAATEFQRKMPPQMQPPQISSSSIMPRGACDRQGGITRRRPWLVPVWLSSSLSLSARTLTVTLPYHVNSPQTVGDAGECLEAVGDAGVTGEGSAAGATGEGSAAGVTGEGSASGLTGDHSSCHCCLRKTGPARGFERMCANFHLHPLGSLESSKGNPSNFSIARLHKTCEVKLTTHDEYSLPPVGLMIVMRSASGFTPHQTKQCSITSALVTVAGSDVPYMVI